MLIIMSVKFAAIVNDAYNGDTISNYTKIYSKAYRKAEMQLPYNICNKLDDWF
jgi:hypothetical protein